MTCIVGYIDKEEKAIYIGGDSAGTAGTYLRKRKDPKVFIRNKFIMGFTSSFRMGQLLMCDERFYIREQNEEETDYQFMVSAFIPAIQKLFTEGGYIEKDLEVLSGGTFIVGYKDRLYMIQSDFQVAEYYEDYIATGCGENYAMGSLYSSAKKNIKAKIEQALTCASEYSGAVSPPFVILKITYK